MYIICVLVCKLKLALWFDINVLIQPGAITRMNMMMIESSRRWVLPLCNVYLAVVVVLRAAFIFGEEQVLR